MSALLTSARSKNREVVSHLEESQAEPFSDYYIYVQDSLLLVDSNWHIPPEILHGELEIALETDENSGLRGIVKTVRGPDKTALAPIFHQ